MGKKGRAKVSRIREDSRVNLRSLIYGVMYEENLLADVDTSCSSEEGDDRSVMLVAVKLPAALVEGIDTYMRKFKYESRSQVIRLALVNLFRRSIWKSR